MNTKIINEALLKKASKEKDFDEACEMILEAFGQEDCSIINIIPNVSKARDILKNDFPNLDYEEYGFWIVTEDADDDLYFAFDTAGLFPYSGYGYNYDEFCK